MTSRLQRMLLVNTRTSGTATSGAVSEIDPRGGAAIVGQNGAGKTTTLQLLPLFLGCPPNQIAPPSGTREPIMRFVCPSMQSALVFEYQRGDGPLDVQIAVLRRQDGSDAPEYRFFNTPFIEELFIETASDGDGSVFLDDERSVAKAAQLGITTSPKLHASQYRAVILNTRTGTKDSEHIRKVAREFSFSRRSMPHLDRLVATVIREHIDFKDFTAVAVNMVFEQLGGGIGLQGQQQKLAVKQGEGQINLWLKNRDASEKALALKPTVEALRTLLGEHDRVNYELGALRGRVQGLKNSLADYCGGLSGEIEAREADFADFVANANDRANQLQGEVSRLEGTHTQARTAYLSAKANKDYFAEKDAAKWALEADKLPRYKTEFKQHSDRLEALAGEGSGIVQRYQELIAQLNASTAKTVAEMENAKTPYRNAFDAETVSLRAQESDELDGLRIASKDAADAEQEALVTLTSEIGACGNRIANPSAQPALVERVNSARSALEDHRKLLADATKDSYKAETANREARLLFEKAELQVQDARENRQRCEQEAGHAQTALSPHASSLHASLLKSADQSWRTSLARVIRPELLTHEGLKPYFAGEDTGNAYGWSMDLSALESPDWIQDDVLVERLAKAKEAVQTAEQQLGVALEHLKQTSSELETARLEHTNAAARYGVLDSKTAYFEHQLQEATQAMNDSLRVAAGRAQSELQTLNAQRDRLRKNLKQIQTDLEASLKAKKEEYQVALQQAEERRNASLRSIDIDIETFKKSQASARKTLEEERDRLLLDQGVDTTALAKLRKEVDALKSTIVNVEEKASLVAQWQKWSLEEGPNYAVGLETIMLRESEKMQQAADLLGQHRKAVDKRTTEHGVRQKQARETLSKAQGEIEILTVLDKELMDFGARFDGEISIDTPASDLKAAHAEINTRRLNLNRRIEIEYNKIKNQLFATESAVKDFIEACINDLDINAPIQLKATRLLIAYERIGREVITHVNSELGTILSHISMFRNRIQSFESEVRNFNKRLQTGLDGVIVGFDSIKDFKISIVSDFTDLDFMGKLRALDDIIRQHRDTPPAEYQTSVPPVAASMALRDFMSVLSNGSLEIDLAQHVTLSGSASVNGDLKVFKRESELEKLSSNGISAIALITLLCGMLNVIRGNEPIHFPWVSDEVTRFDSGNFARLMGMLKENKIDVITASPSLTPAGYAHFKQRYLLGPEGSVAVYSVKRRPSVPTEAVESAT